MMELKQIPGHKSSDGSDHLSLAFSPLGIWVKILFSVQKEVLASIIVSLLDMDVGRSIHTCPLFLSFPRITELWRDEVSGHIG